MIPLKKCCAVANGLSHVLLFMAAAAFPPSMRARRLQWQQVVVVVVAMADAVRDMGEVRGICGRSSYSPGRSVGLSAGRTSFASLGVVSDRFSSLTRLRAAAAAKTVSQTAAAMSKPSRH